jgi:ribonuclease BN (tRNA processing enzyme)
MDNQKEQPNQLNIEISEEMSEGSYANLAIITHSHAEFIVDFVNVMPGTPKSKVKSRIILTPTHAKRFMKAMIDNVKKFETVNGTIQDIEAVELPLNFGGPTAQA